MKLRFKHLFLCLLQLRVRARDGGSPPCETYSVLTVAVRRNEFTPRWTPSAVYTTTILETHNILQPVYTVSAVDQDTSVSSYFKHSNRNYF